MRSRQEEISDGFTDTSCECSGRIPPAASAPAGPAHAPLTARSTAPPPPCTSAMADTSIECRGAAAAVSRADQLRYRDRRRRRSRRSLQQSTCRPGPSRSALMVLLLLSALLVQSSEADVNNGRQKVQEEQRLRPSVGVSASRRRLVGDGDNSTAPPTASASSDGNNSTEAAAPTAAAAIATTPSPSSVSVNGTDSDALQPNVEPTVSTVDTDSFIVTLPFAPSVITDSPTLAPTDAQPTGQPTGQPTDFYDDSFDGGNPRPRYELPHGPREEQREQEQEQNYTTDGGGTGSTEEPSTGTPTMSPISEEPTTSAPTISSTSEASTDSYDGGGNPNPRNEQRPQKLLNYTAGGKPTAPTTSPGADDIKGRQENDDKDTIDLIDGDNDIDEPFPITWPPPTTEGPTRNPTLPPTAKPTKSPVTEQPTPAPSPKPTNRPSDAPTREPTKNPTRSPTIAPTLSPVTESPTRYPTSRPTRMPQVEPTTQYPTKSPTKNPTASPTPMPSTFAPTLAPILGPTATPTLNPIAVPTVSPTLAPTLATQQFLVELEFVFDDCQKLEDSSIILWEEVTAEQIYDHLYWTSNEIGMEEFLGMGVNTRIRRQIQGAAGTGPPGEPLQVASDRGAARLRSLQTTGGDGGTPLTIIAINVINFKSPKEYTQAEIEDHVGKAFNSESDREKYIADLKATNDRSFRTINSVVVLMNGAPVPEAPTPAPTYSGEGKSGGGTNIWLIIGPAIGGVVVVASLCILVYSRQQNKRKKAFMANAYDATRVSKFVDVDVNHDDVSTLGDPVYPAGAMFSNALVKDTADNSIVSADYDYARAFGTTNDAPTATTPKSDDADRSQGSGSGRATLSTVTGGLAGKMDASLFDDDASFEKQYCAHEERIEIDAPAGKLGVVIDTPVGGAPVVHAIKDTSVLADQVRVGDQLVSVDDVDCTQLSAIEVSKLISSRAKNPSRILVFIRLSAGEQ